MFNRLNRERDRARKTHRASGRAESGLESIRSSQSWSCQHTFAVDVSLIRPINESINTNHSRNMDEQS